MVLKFNSRHTQYTPYYIKKLEKKKTISTSHKFKPLTRVNRQFLESLGLQVLV